MSSDVELDIWRRQWQAESVEVQGDHLAADLKKHVERQSRWLKFGLIVPVLVTLVVGGGLILRALRTAQPVDVALAAEGWLFIFVTWAGSLWIARGTWRPLGETTAAFVELSVRRRRANLKAVPFAMSLYVVQLVIVALLSARYSEEGLGALMTAWPVVILGGIGLPALLVAGFFYARRQRAAIEHLLDLRSQLVGE